MCVTQWRKAQHTWGVCVLCDGMGTGREAARAADSCAYFLSELLKAGNRMQLSLRLLNNFIRAEGEEE